MKTYNTYIMKLQKSPSSHHEPNFRIKKVK